MDLQLFIGQASFFFARARAHVRSIVLSFCISFSAFSALANEPTPLKQVNGALGGFTLDHSLESATRTKMKVSDQCDQIKTIRNTALMVMGDVTAFPHIQSGRGIIVLEGLVEGAEPKVLTTVFLSPYQNYPQVLQGPQRSMPVQQYPLALTFSPTLVGQGDMTFQKGDYIAIRTARLLFSYPLPAVKVPSEGVLRLYAGSDDQLYYDKALTHPLHEGPCKKRTK